MNKISRTATYTFTFFMGSILCLCFSAGLALAAATIDHDTIHLQSLNKATARTTTFEMKIGETIKMGPLYIRPQACRTTPVTEKPESAAFIQIWTAKDAATEIDTDTPLESEWVFSGWMFASSPGLSSMDHSVYDLWVVDCGSEDSRVEETLLLIKEDDANDSAAEGADKDEAEGGIIIEDDSEEAPIVIIDGQQLTLPDTEVDERFQAYDEDQSAPILHLE